MYPRRMAYRTGSEPDCAGRCSCLATLGVSATTASKASGKSFGCGDVKRMRASGACRMCEDDRKRALERAAGPRGCLLRENTLRRDRCPNTYWKRDLEIRFSSTRQPRVSIQSLDPGPAPPRRRATGAPRSVRPSRSGPPDFSKTSGIRGKSLFFFFFFFFVVLREVREGKAARQTRPIVTIDECVPEKSREKTARKRVGTYISQSVLTPARSHIQPQFGMCTCVYQTRVSSPLRCARRARSRPSIRARRPPPPSLDRGTS